MSLRIGWRPHSNDGAIASVRFRALTPIRALKALGVEAELFDERRAQDYHAVVFSKRYDAKSQVLARALSGRGAAIIFDLSDNHFYNPYDLRDYRAAAENIRTMIAAADLVTCCSEELARVIEAEASPQAAPAVIGDAVEAFAVHRAPEDAVFRMLWFGSHGSPNAPAGMEDLLRIREHIDAAAAARPSELVIVSNNEAKFRVLKDSFAARVRYEPWSEAAFARELSRAHAVVVPACPNPFTACKSTNRPATALWHGAPVIADAVPSYETLAPFITIDDWARGFAEALAGSDAMRARTAAGQAHVRASMTEEAIGAQWLAAIEGVTKRVQTSRR